MQKPPRKKIRKFQETGTVICQLLSRLKNQDVTRRLVHTEFNYRVVNLTFGQIQHITLGIIHLVCTQSFFSKKTILSYPLICNYGDQGVKNNSCAKKNFAYVLNEWSPMVFLVPELVLIWWQVFLFLTQIMFFFDTQDLREMHKKNETISKKEEEERQYLQSEYEKVKDENSELQVGCFRVHRTS